nr:hypothetical protein [Occultella kanbiaonis]
MTWPVVPTLPVSSGRRLGIDDVDQFVQLRRLEEEQYARGRIDHPHAGAQAGRQQSQGRDDRRVHVRDVAGVNLELSTSFQDLLDDGRQATVHRDVHLTAEHKTCRDFRNEQAYRAHASGVVIPRSSKRCHLVFVPPVAKRGVAGDRSDNETVASDARC